MTLQLIATMRIFSQVYVMTKGGPAGSSFSVIHYIYTDGIVSFRSGLCRRRFDDAICCDYGRYPDPAKTGPRE